MTIPPPGPYPQVDRADDLQQASLLALKNALPSDLFLVRDERIDDKGVDLSLELKHDGSFLNIRSQIQMKGTDKHVLNNDGSLSYRVATSNLNYLLNGPSPLYIVWIAPRNELRYAWARDEARRLHLSNSEWRQQESVTLHFAKTLTANNVNDLHDRIIQEGKLHRETHDLLARASLSEPLVIGINPHSLSVTDPDKIYNLLLSSGLSAVSSGFTREVFDLFRLLTASQASHPRISLILAYAHISRGEYFSAGGLIARALLGKSTFSEYDQHFLASLENAFEYHAGMIDYDTYITQERKLARDGPIGFVLQHELESERLDFLKSPDPEHRNAALRKLRETVAKIGSDPHSSSSFKLRARIARLYADTFETSTQFTQQLMLLRMRHDMGFPMDSPGVFDRIRLIKQSIDKLLADSMKLVKDIRDEEHPLLLAEALVTQAVILIDQTKTCRFFFASSHAEPPSITRELDANVRQLLDSAIGIYAHAGYLELEIWAKMWLADWLEIAGETTEAKKLAESAQPSAVAMGFRMQLSRAEAHLSGDTDYQKTLLHLRSERDMDPIMAEESDDEMRRYAAKSLEAMELPAERLPVVEREWLCLRDMAREKVHWCRHLDMVQDLRHTQSLATYYVRDPERRCICEKFGYKTNVTFPDWGAMIAGFKQAYCKDCSAREPKGALNARP